jgi:hypothetical protein
MNEKKIRVTTPLIASTTANVTARLGTNTPSSALRIVRRTIKQ